MNQVPRLAKETTTTNPSGPIRHVRCGPCNILKINTQGLFSHYRSPITNDMGILWICFDCIKQHGLQPVNPQPTY